MEVASFIAHIFIPHNRKVGRFLISLALACVGIYITAHAHEQNKYAWELAGALVHGAGAAPIIASALRPLGFEI